MEIFSAASMLAIAGKLVTAEVTKAAISGAKSQLQPDKMALVLKQAIESAQATQPGTGGIFFRCQSKAAEGFLAQFFQSIEVLKELQKPLQASGKPDVDLLMAAFDRSAKQHSEMQDYIPDSLRLWMEKFADSYFEQIQGICFQVAKAQYLKQLAHQIRNVKFVGFAVSDSDIEQPEILAQIFVMPDVQEEQKGWAIRDRSAPRIPAQTVINNQKKAVVLGAPGSGKTMLASYFALMLCQNKPGQIGLPDADYLPIVVRNSAAEALGKLGNASSDVVNGLLCLLRNRVKRSSDGIEAAPALCRLAKTSDTVLPEVVQWLEQNRDEDGIGDAIDCLWSIVVE